MGFLLFLLIMVFILNMIRLIGLSYFNTTTKEYRIKIHEHISAYSKNIKIRYIPESREVWRWWKFSSAQSWNCFYESESLAEAEEFIEKLKEADRRENNKKNPTYKYYN